MRLTLKRITASIQDIVPGAELVYNKSRSYFYLTGADTSTWPITSILTSKLSLLTMAQWREAIKDLKKMADGRKLADSNH